jgi:hypothetical protein
MRGELEQVFEALNRAGVRYLVVGGVAVVMHGHLRTTQDLDLVIQLGTQNVRAALDTLSALGFQPRAPVSLHDFADPEKRERWRREKNLVVFSLWSRELPAFTIDLFAAEPFDFDAAFARAVRVPFERTEATVLALVDLLELKRKSGRPLDLDDVQALSSLGSAPQQGDADEYVGEGSPDRIGEARDPWELQRRAQARHGLRFSPAERLRWLEDTMETMRELCGRARLGRPTSEKAEGSEQAKP